MTALPTTVVILIPACIAVLATLCILLGRELHHAQRKIEAAELRTARWERVVEQHLHIMREASLISIVDSCERDHGRVLDDHFDQVAAILAPDTLPDPGWCDCADQTGPCTR